MRNIYITLLVLFFTLQAFAQNKVSYEYDALNQLTKVTYSNGTVVSYTYDALGNRLSKKVVSTAVVKQYAIELTASPAEGGTVSGAGTYNEGTSVTLKAVPADGYEFTKWSDDNTSSIRTVTVSKALSLTAYFTKKAVESKLGDVNSDGVVDASDLSLMKDVYLGFYSASDIYDLDKDGKVTIADVAISIAIVNGTYGTGGTTTEATTGEYNNHAWVDLGLPSGTLWATCNVGASTSVATGNYFAWGETTGYDEGKTSFKETEYKYWDSTNGYNKYYYTHTDISGVEDKISKLQSSDDAATSNWGGVWRLPTKYEAEELQDTLYTTWTLTTLNGVSGYKIESIVEGYEGNSIFLPVTGYRSTKINRETTHGYYWCVNLDTTYPRNARFFGFSQTNPTKGSHPRYQAMCVRPVVSKSKIK